MAKHSESLGAISSRSWYTKTSGAEMDQMYQALIAEDRERRTASEAMAGNVYQEPDPQWMHRYQEDIEKGMMEMYAVDPAMMRFSSSASSEAPSAEKTLKLIKKSIKEIKAEAVSPEAQQKVKSKVDRLLALGVKAQAAILEAELNLRIRLARVQEWNYKVLTYDGLKDFEAENKMTATRDGLRVHIDKLENYVGNTTVNTEKKDMIMPDIVLGELEEARKRQVFDDFGVLWIEKVKDPLLLGLINGCKDYFFIAEWGEDIKFNDIVKERDGKGKEVS